MAATGAAPAPRRRCGVRDAAPPERSGERQGVHVPRRLRPTDYAKCGNRPGGSIVQVLADLTAPNPNTKRAEIDLYTKTSPATLILRCDTTLCDTGGDPGHPGQLLALRQRPAWAPRPRVLGRGRWGDQDVCVDYVQSKRDGASDTILYLLFTRDIRDRHRLSRPARSAAAGPRPARRASPARVVRRRPRP